MWWLFTVQNVARSSSNRSHHWTKTLPEASLFGGRQYRFAYSARGLLAADSLSSAGIQLGRYTYDAGDHLRTVSRPGRGTISFSYDAIGRLRSASGPTVDARLTYEANSGLLSTVATGATATARSHTLSYDGSLPAFVTA